ncbi:hypothetical protein [Niallia circulans]|uniref:hypothetical protein n=1 Tax=Niallia circulans TaxID=1397 RepID=UPI0026EA4EA7|nr:hypothetical protein [Niallia circulans]
MFQYKINEGILIHFMNDGCFIMNMNNQEILSCKNNVSIFLNNLKFNKKTIKNTDHITGEEFNVLKEKGVII